MGVQQGALNRMASCNHRHAQQRQSVAPSTGAKHRGVYCETGYFRGGRFASPWKRGRARRSPMGDGTKQPKAPPATPSSELRAFCRRGALELMSCDPLLGRCRKPPDSVQSPTRQRLSARTKKKPCTHGRVFLAGGRFEPELFSRP
jgi:hypothetical protein